MECKKIKEKISAYIDDVLAQDEKVLIEEHLKSCKKCSMYLDNLRKTIGYVKTVEEVEPPSWLTQRIMARIRTEAEPKRGILRRLFSPFYLKLPVVAVATLLIALTTIYVFKSIEPEIKLAKAPSVEIVKQEHPPAVASQDKIRPKSAGPIKKGEDASRLAHKDREKAPVKEETSPSFAPEPPLPYSKEKQVEAKQPIAAGKIETARQYDYAAKPAAPEMKQPHVSLSEGVRAHSQKKSEIKAMREQELENESVLQYSGEQISQKIICTTDKELYVQGDNVDITITNASEKDVEIVDRKFIDGGFATIEIRTSKGLWKQIELYAAANVAVNKTLKPGESRIYIWKTAGYNRSDTIAVSGIYRICLGEHACTGNFEIKEK